MIYFVAIVIVLVLAIGLVVYRTFEGYTIRQHNKEGRPKDWRP